MPHPPYTIASAARQLCIHTQFILNWAAGGTQTGSEGQGSSEGEWRVEGWGSKGGSGSGGRVGERVEGGRFNNGTSKEGPERGMDGAGEIKAVGSERRKEGAGWEGTTKRVREAREE